MNVKEEILRVPAKKRSNAPFIILGITFVVGIFALIWYAVSKQIKSDNDAAERLKHSDPAPGSTTPDDPGIESVPAEQSGPWKWVPINNATSNFLSTFQVVGSTTPVPFKYSVQWVDNTYTSLKMVIIISKLRINYDAVEMVFPLSGLKIELSSVLSQINQTIVASYDYQYTLLYGKISPRLVLEKSQSLPTLRLMVGYTSDREPTWDLPITFVIQNVR